jgi:hypothetical protein
MLNINFPLSAKGQNRCADRLIQVGNLPADCLFDQASILLPALRAKRSSEGIHHEDHSHDFTVRRFAFSAGSFHTATFFLKVSLSGPTLESS